MYTSGGSGSPAEKQALEAIHYPDTFADEIHKKLKAPSIKV